MPAFIRLTAVALLLMATAGQAQEGTELGTIDCRVEGEQALVLGAGEGLVCTFASAEGGTTDTYFGAIQELDPTVEITPDATIRWVVLSVGPSGYSPGQLEGDYRVMEEAAGLGGPLVGGAQGDLMLMPIEMPSDDPATNLAPGIIAFQLRTVKA